ncbi:hypothetical protein LZ198_33720 [Myxococcus sp. K15C18031901]|uniref:hypothetical protein n=1 Tax=Myxococcus dinghuensis TaxID=2906761 RepID=UPI0020A8050F|nr:hypothetical protein [Myxococcus dinghuensis]MCP3103849.1 hypothetical protein [Myxococcus dinghuensis]
MQLRKMMLVLSALGAVSGLMAGCGDDETSASGCNTNDDCAGTEICHPTAGVCVTTCESGSDCPDTAKTCAALGGTGSNANTKICQCSTDVLCNGGTGSTSTDLVCSDLDNVCVPKCGSDTDCSVGRVCNTGTGQCEEDDTTGKTCSGTAQSTCSYGEFCSSSTCTAAPVAPSTCENFSSNRPSWNVTSSNGPVIYQVTRVRYETNSSYCAQGAGADDAFIVSVRAYRTDTDWPATRNGLAGFFYVTTAASQTDVFGKGLLVPGTGYNRSTTNLRDAEFQVYLCRPTGSQAIQVGFYFTNGNPVCQNITR